MIRSASTTHVFTIRRNHSPVATHFFEMILLLLIGWLLRLLSNRICGGAVCTEGKELFSWSFSNSPLPHPPTPTASKLKFFTSMNLEFEKVLLRDDDIMMMRLQEPRHGTGAALRRQ